MVRNRSMDSSCLELPELRTVENLELGDEIGTDTAAPTRELGKHATE